VRSEHEFLILLLFIVTYARMAAVGCCAIGRLINICLAGTDRTHDNNNNICIYIYTVT
jgi:hypothetical protein